MNFLFLGYGPIASIFIQKHIAPVSGNKAWIVSTHSEGTNADGATFLNKPEVETFDEIDVVINSWKSLDSLNRGWEIDYLTSLASSVNSKKLFLNLSSVAVYGECKDAADEDAVLNPINEYGIKKLEFENFLKVIGVPNLLNLRISNVFGDPRFDDLINRVYKAITQGFSIKLFEPDKIFRDFIYIDHVAKHMHQLVLGSDFSSGPRQIDINISTGLSLSLFEVIQITENHLNRSLDFEIASSELGVILESRISNRKLLDLNGHEALAVKDQIMAYLSQLGHSRL